MLMNIKNLHQLAGLPMRTRLLLRLLLPSAHIRHEIKYCLYLNSQWNVAQIKCYKLEKTIFLTKTNMII